MTVIVIDRAGLHAAMTELLSDLRAAHLEAASVVADLDLDDGDQWREVEKIVIGITEAAYAVAAHVAGTPAGAIASSAPPIVRVRELATAQRQLFAALDRCPVVDRELLEEAVWRIRQLGRLPQCLALS